MRPFFVVALLKAIQAWDRLCLARLVRRHPGLVIDPSASSNLARARFDLAPGARLRIGPGVRVERQRDGVRFCVARGGDVVIGEGVWLRSELEPVHLAVFEGARLEIGANAFLNGCHLSAKESVTLGEYAMIGPGSRVFDSDQHPLDDANPEAREAVSIGAFAWVAADVTLLKGARIGAHSVIGARSVVGGEIPAHSLAFGIPARVRGTVGDRSRHPF
ncbi:MAG: hypothetical protein VCB78_01980 [Myxococcota bacterium]